jgi:SAM-dependent methyltransferase
MPTKLDPAPGALFFRCNICGVHNGLLASTIHREDGACCGCGGNVRFRSIAAVLTQRLLGKIVILDELESNDSIHGVGMSDAECYSSRLQSKFKYTNTFFHCEPLLDITQPDERWIGRNDFVISSDVFEHVAPPVQRAFDNLHALLRPGGTTVFSVPFSLENETQEHFPNLHKFTVREESSDVWVLDNVTTEGKSEQFRNLVFHGGPGTTIEMRLFSLPALKRHFEAAGFVDFRVHNEASFENGIFWLEPWSITISAVRSLT